jgi:hypothetical protein
MRIEIHKDKILLDRADSFMGEVVNKFSFETTGFYNGRKNIDIKRYVYRTGVAPVGLQEELMKFLIENEKLETLNDYSSNTLFKHFDDIDAAIDRVVEEFRDKVTLTPLQLKSLKETLKHAIKIKDGDAIIEYPIIRSLMHCAPNAGKTYIMLFIAKVFKILTNRPSFIFVPTDIIKDGIFNERWPCMAKMVQSKSLVRVIFKILGLGLY